MLLIATIRIFSLSSHIWVLVKVTLNLETSEFLPYPPYGTQELLVICHHVRNGVLYISYYFGILIIYHVLRIN